MNSFMSRQTRAQHKEQLRNAMLVSARELFLQEGYENFSMRKLAGKVQCSPGNLYLYFKDKEDILHLLVDESFERLTALLNGLCSRNQDRDPVDVLKKGLYTYVDFGLRNANDYRIALLMTHSLPHNSAQAPAPVAVLTRMVSRCLEEGRLVESDPDLITQSLWAAVHGITSLLIQRPDYPWAGKSRVIEHLIGSALSGIIATGTPEEVRARSVEAVA
jgi:AcrR family transcriptional regulator